MEVTDPLPCKVPMVSLKAPIANVPPVLIVTVAVSGNWLAAPNCAVAVAPMTKFPPIAFTPAVLLKASVPAVTVVTPVCALDAVPDSVSVPAPILVRPPVVAGMAADIVRLFVVISSVEVDPVDSERTRSVVAVAPVYCSVPPPRTRLPATLVAWPRFPCTPPLPIVPTLRVPPLIVVAPVYVLTPLRVTVPVVDFVRGTAPPRIAETVPCCSA